MYVCQWCDKKKCKKIKKIKNVCMYVNGMTKKNAKK